MAQELVSIKGTRSGLVILLDSNCNFEELRNSLKAKFTAARGFFQGARFILQPASGSLSHTQAAELEAICRQHGLIPSRDITLPAPLRPSRLRQKENCPAEDQNLPTFLEAATLRSGQKKIAAGNLVLLGNVHRGAEVIASGNILVMGTLQGTAHAGAEGDETAVIVAYRLQPTQLRIATKIARSPEGAAARPYPEIARIVEGKIVIEPYTGYTG
ncbi:MAG: septum site-determining protein MinC [Clostridia bacterium]|nr:septum site-determining protein MinC [Clostridia bacterium]